REFASVVVVGFAIEISTAVDPNDDRLRAMAFARGKDIQIQAVLGDAWWGGNSSELISLRTRVPVAGGVEGSGPMTDRLRRPPAEVSNRGGCVGDSQEDV